MQNDGLAEKLYTSTKTILAEHIDLMEWRDLPDHARAPWERLAIEIRTHVMLFGADMQEALLKMGAGDPEQALYEPGIRFMIESTRKACARSIEEAAAIALLPVAKTVRGEA